MEVKIVGGSLPVAICSVSSGETLITEAGAMSWMSENMKMETTTGGGLGKLFSRAVSGESLFQNRYVATGGDGEIAFAAKMPGSIRTYEISPGRSLIAQKGAFLASSDGIEVSIHYKKKFGSSVFGGEGFIMQKISGSGTAILEMDGFAVDYDLGPGQKMILDTGHLVAMDETCTMDIQAVSGMKNMFLGGEGLFNTVVTGPGKITLQTMPISTFANALYPFMPTPTASN